MTRLHLEDDKTTLCGHGAPGVSSSETLTPPGNGPLGFWEFLWTAAELALLLV